MFDIDFSGGRILTRKGHSFTRPGEVAFKKDGAMAENQRLKQTQGQDKKTNPLDMQEAIDLHRRLLSIYRYELERQSDNRIEMAADEDMYDHIQWSIEEINALKDRGQTPIVFNLIQTTINWVLGSQRRAPTDFKVLPRRKEGSGAAKRKNELLRHLRDENDTEMQVALAFADAVKAGVGWLETGEGDPADGPIVFDRHESWRNMIWDSRSKHYDLSDARYVCRNKWLDLDLATALWPRRAGLLKESTEQRMLASGISDYGDEPMDSSEEDISFTAEVTSGGYAIRERVRCIEMWFKRPMDVPVIKGGDFHRELFDPWSEGHWASLAAGNATLVTRPREVMHVAIMTEKGLLDVRQSPYRHNKFPFTAVWGYRRGRDNLPYGMIRGLRDIQRDLNKRASKALHYLNSTQVYVEEDAVDDIEELRLEAGRPDAVIEYKSGKAPPVIKSDAVLADAHVNLMSMDAQMIQQVGGVTDENLGRRTNASSGKAIVARQEQGALATATFSDNLRSSLKDHGTKKLINIEQFYSERQVFRITNERGVAEFVEINDGFPDNAISLFKADFVMAEEDWKATTRQADAAQLMDLMGQLSATAPQLVVSVIDLVIEASDLPKREEIVKRVRQVTGMADPDEDPNNPSPETLSLQQQAAEQAQLSKRMMMAEIAEKEGKAQKIHSEATRNWLGLRSDNLDQIKQAVEATINIAGAPGVASAVDGMMRMATEEAYRMGMSNAMMPPQPQQQMPTQSV
ncbi:MAG: hypothetical protein EP336_09455 [Rhodobacteraceae bacterium]|nr:MAG: hypothetical protein EP336_09455 [Paracoccaceae bacterium]